MKTNVFTVKPASFRKKIDHRRTVMEEQRNAMRKPNSLKDLPESGGTTSSLAFKNSIQNGNKFTEETVESEEFLSGIDSAMRLQQNTYEAVLATSNAFKLQLLPIFLESFVSIVFYVYFFISVIVEPTAFKLPQTEMLIFLAEFFCDQCIFIILLVVSFEGVRAVNRDTQRMVNKNIIHARNDMIRARFIAFSQQLQSNVMEFKVFGFFALDGSVIFSIISATTTYLIIMLQTLGSRSVVSPYFEAVQHHKALINKNSTGT